MQLVYENLFKKTYEYVGCGLIINENNYTNILVVCYFSNRQGPWLLKIVEMQ
jgi:hypothetical protein